MQHIRGLGLIAAVGLIVWGAMGGGNTSSSSVRCQTPIADLRVGMRLAAFNPDVTSSQRATFQDPDQATWRMLELELPKASGGVLEITMLRPLEWLGAHHAQVGSSIHLDMPELGATGQARVLGIYPCPAIQEGPGQVVTATFAHPATHQILNVTIGAGPDAETIGVTETHPFWSVKHNAFVPIGQLSVGDEVLTLHGQTKRIETLLPRPGPAEKVYNLEVHGEHTYFVGQQQLLVHNNGCKKIIALGRDEIGGGYKELSKQKGGVRWEDWNDFNITQRNPRSRFGRAFHDAANKADEIHFSLDGYASVASAKKAVELGKRGFWNGNMTNAELEFIMNNPAILSKTKFFRTIDSIVTEVGRPF